jgi:hypothetical protein
MRLSLPAAIAMLVLAAGCSGSGSDQRDHATESTTTPSTLIDYGDDGIVVAGKDDGALLVGAPADFTAFIVDELARQQATQDKVCTEKPQIRVERIDIDGWAAGGISIPQCGGTGALWAKSGGAWKTVWSDQTLPDCSVLKKYDFPPRIAGSECGTADGKTRSYP